MLSFHFEIKQDRLYFRTLLGFNLFLCFKGANKQMHAVARLHATPSVHYPAEQKPTPGQHKHSQLEAFWDDRFIRYSIDLLLNAIIF